MKKKSPTSKPVVHFCQGRSLDAASLDDAIAEFMRHDQVLIGNDGELDWTEKGRAIWKNAVFSESDQILGCAIFLAKHLHETRASLYLLQGVD